MRSYTDKIGDILGLFLLIWVLVTFVLLNAMLVRACVVSIESDVQLMKACSGGLAHDLNADSSPEVDSIPESELPPLVPTEVSRVSIIAAGDNIVHRGVLSEARTRAASQEGREFDFRPMFDEVKELIEKADIAFVNQETLTAGEEFGYSFYPSFNSPRQTVYDLIEVGFDVFNIATNHMCDMGAKGLANTIDFHKTLEGVTMIGGYSTEDDYETPRIVEKNGMKLAFLGYTEHTNGASIRGEEPILPYTDDATLKRQIKAAREVADAVIVSVHWGNENTNTPTPEQKRLAKLIAEAGADVIIGHHPHVIQPIEWIETERGRTLCAYSLGNILSMMATWQNMIGGFLGFELVLMSDGEIKLESVEFTPTVFYYGPSYTRTKIYYLSDFTEASAASHGTGNNYGSRATAEEMREYVNHVLGDFIANQ